MAEAVMILDDRLAHLPPRKRRDLARAVEAWPRNTRLSRRRFNLLRDASVKARYSRHYTITP